MTAYKAQRFDDYRGFERVSARKKSNDLSTATSDVSSAKQNNSRNDFVFGTKAETLYQLQPLLHLSRVLDLFWFTARDWSDKRKSLLDAIRLKFDLQPVVVRSSGQNEDDATNSQAGIFASCLNVKSADNVALEDAVNVVLDSFDTDTENQVLIQPMLKDVVLSGVIMTRDLNTGAPYYILNYDDESGRTDTITSGNGVNKTVCVHHDSTNDHMDSPRVAALIAFTRELETILGSDVPLDIEFARTGDGVIYLLQVRRITVQENWRPDIISHVHNALGHASDILTEHLGPRPHLGGSRTILGQMSDWNPAEIIGPHSRPLAISLYRNLITDSVWQEARTEMGYQPVPQTPLLLTFGDQPYIDVRASFNSFLPAGLPADTRQRLVDAWLDRLEQHPEYHDKVEFEIAQTIVDFTFDTDHQTRYAGVLSSEALFEYRGLLTRLTRQNLELAPKASLPSALVQIARLEDIQGRRLEQVRSLSDLGLLQALLDECRQLGTKPFAVIARHAFIAETLLRSATARGALKPERVQAFKYSLRTITTDFAKDFVVALADKAIQNRFLALYGHLRPGTYDIMSMRYDQRDDLFDVTPTESGWKDKEPFILSQKEIQDLRSLFEESGLDGIEPTEFIDYAQLAIANRERAKFIFSRHLSDTLELIARWGGALGLERDALSYLFVRDLLDQQSIPTSKDSVHHFQSLAQQNRQTSESMSSIRLGYLIRDQRDLFVVPLHRTTPNFVNTQRIEGPPLRIDNHTQGHIDLAGHIICIQNADPGFDWIFTRNIIGLVSQYGGANSHMTIRCAELGLPAAIGVGEQTFERIASAHLVELDPGAHILRPIHG
ncbi:MAG: PEP/pyruvate-binding domain-containing protein [Myxococcota bacterium]|nr:PEP/pyruvate-binding domain-containing protein [Myxococcota bacterium]